MQRERIASAEREEYWGQVKRVPAPDTSEDAGAPPTIVYVDGVFDLFHPGHIAFMKKAKALGGTGARLLVGVITDEDATWKRRPVMSHAERVTMVSHCTEVWKVVERPPLVLTPEFLAENAIDLVVHGDDSKQEEFFAVAIAQGKMRYVPYEQGVSTTSLIKRAAVLSALLQ
jgi:cytidyltransferase-like protein